MWNTGKFSDIDGRIDDGRIAMVIALDLVLSVGGDSNELVGLLSSTEVGLAKRFNEKFEDETNERV